MAFLRVHVIFIIISTLSNGHGLLGPESFIRVATLQLWWLTRVLIVIENFPAAFAFHSLAVVTVQKLLSCVKVEV